MQKLFKQSLRALPRLANQTQTRSFFTLMNKSKMSVNLGFNQALFRTFSSNEPEELSYIKEMKDMDCWKNALENQDRP
jgi:hypothetical protein